MARRYDDARVHLEVLGQTTVVTERVALGACRPIDILPLARAVANKLAQIGEERAVADGESVSCRAGCGACCRQLIPISFIEALALARLVDRMPPARRRVVRGRFTAAVRKLEEVGLLGRDAPKARLTLEGRAGEGYADEVSRRYFEAKIPCPFLEKESCSIHPERPMICREYLVVTPPELCATWSPDIATTSRPLEMGIVLAELASTAAPVPPRLIPLTLALEWVEANRSALDVEVDGEELFVRLTELMRVLTKEAKPARARHAAPPSTSA